jgi:thiosulfate/3-mercaptopyruvate sulfurtransferase
VGLEAPHCSPPRQGAIPIHQLQRDNFTMRTLLKPSRFMAALLSAALLAFAATAFSADKPAASIPLEHLVQPADFAKQLQDTSAPKPLMLHVGFKTMFDQAHIPGSEYAGPGNTGAGLQVLRDRVANLPKNTAIMIYCGCCPWSRCPNMAAAYDALIELRFTNIKGMQINDNFGTDWVDKGFPTAKSK